MKTNTGKSVLIDPQHAPREASTWCGLAGHLRQAPFDWPVAGMPAGGYIARRVAVEHPRRAFARFAAAVAPLIVANNRAAFA